MNGYPRFGWVDINRFLQEQKNAGICQNRNPFFHLTILFGILYIPFSYYLLLLSDKSFQAENNSLIYSMLYEIFSNGAYP